MIIYKKFKMIELYKKNKNIHDKLFLHKEFLFGKKDDTFTIIKEDDTLVLQNGYFFIFQYSFPYIVVDLEPTGFLCKTGLWKDKDFSVVILFDNGNSTEDMAILNYDLFEWNENYVNWTKEKLCQYGYLKMNRIGKLVPGRNWELLPPLTANHIKNLFLQ